VSGEGAVRQQVRQVALPIYKPSRSALLPGICRYLLMRPAVFEAWYRMRAFRQLWFGGGIRTLNELGEVAPHSAMERVTSYNRSRLWEFFRVRTEKLMAVLRCIDAVPRDAKVLVIGPRNEAEILLLSLYGFRLQNITGVDLFSYSPLIRLGDMHNLQFNDGTFDVVYTAWTLAYSYDVKRACAEIVRVAKSGAIIATGMSHTSKRSDLDLSDITQGGVTEILALFAPHVDHVYWQESSSVAGTDSAEISTIFRIRKTPDR
jgi:hypothetical protein